MHCSNLNKKILPCKVLEKKILEVIRLKTGNDPLMTFDPLTVIITCAPTEAKSHDQYLTSSLVKHSKYKFLKFFRL